MTKLLDDSAAAETRLIICNIVVNVVARIFTTT
jgi:hypothetical protein